MARDFWFKNTLNVLKDKETYILDIVETLIESIALLIYLLNLEKTKDVQPPVFRDSKTLDHIRKEYLKSMVRTIGVGMKYLSDEIEKDPEAKAAYEVKRNSLHVLQDRLALANTRIDETLSELGVKPQTSAGEE